MKALPLIALLAGLASPAFAQDAPRGSQATNCDQSAFTPVISDRTGEILYWNNPTCRAPRTGNTMAMQGDMMGDGMMGGMMDESMSMENMMDDSMMDESMMN